MGFQPAPVPTPTAPPKVDPFYGHEYIAKLCARFITHLFACPEYPPAPTANHTHSQSAKLPYFIAYALHRTKLHQSVNYAALVLLQRLKARFPTARGSSGHRLFISAFMIASKVMCDDTYSNKSWGIVAQGMFSLREVNQMEREMCSYLEWELTVDARTLKVFEAMVKKDFQGAGPYPTYVLSMFTKKPLPATPPSNGLPQSTSPIPAFKHTNSSTPPPLSATPHERQTLQHIRTKVAQPPPTPSPSSASSYSSAPNTPDTPSSSNSTTTSPTSSASPPTPSGDMEDHSVKIVGHSFSMMKGKEAMAKVQIPTHPLKPKMYAFAIPTGW